MSILYWMFGIESKKNRKPKVSKPTVVKPRDKLLEIKVVVDLSKSSHSTIKQFVFDGYLIPNIDSPLSASFYMKDWFMSRHIGDGYNHEARNFLEACLKTKTSSTLYYCGYEIVVTIMNDDQTQSRSGMKNVY